jgi:hypothetical protein
VGSGLDVVLAPKDRVCDGPKKVAEKELGVLPEVEEFETPFEKFEDASLVEVSLFEMEGAVNSGEELSGRLWFEFVKE